MIRENFSVNTTFESILEGERRISHEESREKVIQVRDNSQNSFFSSWTSVAEADK